MGGGGLIFSNCPRCGSDRIRRGYRRMPIWWRMLGRYNLLCNACNWEFAGWAIPGTVEAAASRRRKKRAEEKKRQSSETFSESNNSVTFSESNNSIETTENIEKSVEPIRDDANNRQKVKVRKRVKVKLNK